MLDDRGRLNIFGWRINIIDFLVVLFILCLTPVGFFAYRIMSKFNKMPEVLEAIDYTITRPCPVCEEPIKIEVKLGEKPERYYKIICLNCYNEIELRTTSEYKRR